jgi:hypothetical protein
LYFSLSLEHKNKHEGKKKRFAVLLVTQRNTLGLLDALSKAKPGVIITLAIITWVGESKHTFKPLESRSPSLELKHPKHLRFYTNDYFPLLSFSKKEQRRMKTFHLRACC